MFTSSDFSEISFEKTDHRSTLSGEALGIRLPRPLESHDRESENNSSTFVVKRVSAVGFCLCGAVKNIIIICVSASMLGEEMVMQQVLGYMCA